MTEQDIGKILGAQLCALVKDSRYGYTSTVSGYSNLNDKGKLLMMELVEMLAKNVGAIAHKEEEERARELMLKSIKT